MTETQSHPEWMGKNARMTLAEVQEFLAGAVVARVATVDAEGRPYITPVWQEWDGAAMWIIPREKTAFVQHLKTNPHVAVSCALDSGTYTRLLIRGQAEIVEGPGLMSGEWLKIAERMATRYLGEHGPEYLVPSLDRPRYLVKVTPDSMITWDGVEWAKKYTE
jgi:PPOX class probable F420-dependent enzyme